MSRRPTARRDGVARTFDAIRGRMFADFAMPSRMAEFRDLLEAARTAGYRIAAVDWVPEPDPTSGSGRPLTLILRHDVDTDPVTARRMWRIEQPMGIGGSFFFRLSTVDLELMREIDAGGGQVGYHYEELATVAKRRHIRDRAAIVGLIPEAQAEFRRNLERLRRRTGLELAVAAAHGDFINRRLGVSNQVLLADPQFRESVGITVEAYDRRLIDAVSTRHSDTLHPTYWTPEDPRLAIARREPVVSVLVHPRHWHVARRVNAADDVGRLVEELRFRFGR